VLDLSQICEEPGVIGRVGRVAVSAQQGAQRLFHPTSAQPCMFPTARKKTARLGREKERREKPFLRARNDTGRRWADSAPARAVCWSSVAAMQRRIKSRAFPAAACSSVSSSFEQPMSPAVDVFGVYGKPSRPIGSTAERLVQTLLARAICIWGAHSSGDDFEQHQEGCPQCGRVLSCRSGTARRRHG